MQCTLVPKATIRTRDPLLTRQPLFQLSYKGKSSSVCSTSVVSRREQSHDLAIANWVLSLHAGLDSRAHPSSPFPRLRQEVPPGHTRSGADDGARTRGLDHGKVALYQLSYIRKDARLAIRPVPVLPRGILLKSIRIAVDAACGR